MRQVTATKTAADTCRWECPECGEQHQRRLPFLGKGSCAICGERVTIFRVMQSGGGVLSEAERLPSPAEEAKRIHDLASQMVGIQDVKFVAKAGAPEIKFNAQIFPGLATEHLSEIADKLNRAIQPVKDEILADLQRKLLASVTAMAPESDPSREEN